MATEQYVFCDLCGEEIPDEELEEGELGMDYTLDLSRLGSETEIDMWKDLCEDCAENVYDDLMDYEWEH